MPRNKEKKEWHGKYDIASEVLKKIYHNIDYRAILLEQNRCSAGIDGFLWVLNTSVFFIDYNFDLIEGDKILKY